MNGEKGRTEGRPPGAGQAQPPLVVHLIYRLTRGGLENGLVNIVNFMPAARYRHAVVCITDFDEFREAIERPDVPVIALHKRPGHDLGFYLRLRGVLRRLRPHIVHTRTFAALDSLWAATAAGVRSTVHAEHGRDLSDWARDPLRRRLVRRMTDRLVDCYVAVTEDIAADLKRYLGVSGDRLVRIYDGVDTQRFHPAGTPMRQSYPPAFRTPEAVVIGMVGNLRPVKNPLGLIRAFAALRRDPAVDGGRLRLVIIGAGALREECEALIEQEGLAGCVWLAGSRPDVPELLRGMDLFVLPSYSEGGSNALLEAMATGLPAVAVDVGGNRELIRDGETGLLVPSPDPEALAQGIARYVRDPDLRRRHGAQARRRAEGFSWEKTVQAYAAVYDRVLAKSRRTPSGLVRRLLKTASRN